MNPVGQLLHETGLTISALARRAQVSRASVSEYAHGHRQPGMAQIERLAAAVDRRAEIAFPPAWDSRKAEFEDVLALADALPLRRQPARVQTWAEVTAR